MKKWIRTVLVIFICIVIHFLFYTLFEGIRLPKTPKVEAVEKIVLEHTDYPNEVKEYEKKRDIEVTKALVGYLRYSPFKKKSNETPQIHLTFVMKDGTEYVISANEETVWWNGKTYALREEGFFVNSCTSLFFR